MNVGSLFSGIGGLDLGLSRAGFSHVFFCESDSYRRDVLAARWPGVPIYEDVRVVGRGLVGRGHESDDASEAGLEGRCDVDLLCGGFPCQDVSVAGRRAGLAGDRSGLFFEFARVIDVVRPRWVLVENVPGLLSSNGGRDFGAVLGTLADLGYGVAWRVLDSRFFGVPQRRRRVFVVGAFAVGDPRAGSERAGAVLAVGSRCPGHPATRGEARPDVASPSASGAPSGGRDVNYYVEDHENGPLRANGAGGPPRTDKQPLLVANGLVKRYGKGTDSDATDTFVVAHALTSVGHDASEDGTGRGTPLIAAPLTKGSATGDGVNAPGRRREDDVNLVIAGPLGGGNDGIGRRSEDDPNLVTAFSWQQGDDSKWTGTGRGRSWVARAGDYAAGLSASGRHDAISGEAVGVRRLTPTECERLQALPDGWTQLGGTPDSRRYAALGDAVTATVAEWIGRRILAA